MAIHDLMLTSKALIIGSKLLYRRRCNQVSERCGFLSHVCCYQAWLGRCNYILLTVYIWILIPRPIVHSQGGKGGASAHLTQWYGMKVSWVWVITRLGPFSIHQVTLLVSWIC